MRNTNKIFKLYAITDRRWLQQNDYTFEKAIEEAIIGGATILQIREKNISFDEYLELATRAQKITKKHNIPLIVNDSIEVALEIDADGVHLGQEDDSIEKAKKLLGEKKIIGISANTLEEALIAEKNGANYLGIDTPFATNSKIDAKNSTFETMKLICEKVKIPCVAIGGINQTTIPLLNNIGLSGVAMISAIFAEKNIKKSTSDLNAIINKIIKN